MAIRQGQFIQRRADHRRPKDEEGDQHEHRSGFLRKLEEVHLELTRAITERYPDDEGSNQAVTFRQRREGEATIGTAATAICS